MSPAESYKRWRTLNIDSLFADAVMDDAAQVVDANTAQLWEGRDASGSMLPLPYSPMTIAIKSAKGQPTDRITLKDTGEFHSGFFAQKVGNEVQLSSKDSKTPKLISEWGKDIFGLDAKSREDLKPQFTHNILKRIRNHVML